MHTYEETYIEHVSKDCLHSIWEFSLGIHQTECHDSIFIYAVSCTKWGVPFVSLLDSNDMVSSLQVNFNKDSSTLDLMFQFVHHSLWYLIAYDDRIESPIVYTPSQTSAMRLWNEDDRCTSWWLPWPNPVWVKYFLDICFEYGKLSFWKSINGSPHGFFSNDMVDWLIGLRNIGDFSIIQRLVIPILPWNAINAINFHCVLVIDFGVSNNSNPFRILSEIQFTSINFNSEWIEVMPCACSKLIIPPSANPLALCLIIHYY